MTQVTAEGLATWAPRSAQRGKGLQGFIAGWAALGVTLSGATQLRMEGLPVGPSELVLAAWMSFVVFLLLRGVRFGSSQGMVVGGYWLAQFVVMGLGAAIAVHTHRSVPGDAIHDGVAFAYVAVLSVVLTLRLYDGDHHEYHWKFARLTLGFNALAAGLLLSLAMATPHLGPIDLWYGGIRFRGWSENPNQMALAMAPMPFLGWWLMRKTSSRLGKAACLLGIALCVAAGIATRSDGMRVAWVASLGAIFGLLFYRVTMRGRSRWLHVTHIIIPALVVIVGIFFGDEIVTQITRIAGDVYAEGDQGEKRFILWAHGLEAISQSPLFGFGPGAFSGYGAPFQGREAHNSFIDWAMSTGGIGIAIYLSLLVWATRCALRSRETMPVAMLISIVAVSVFGYVLRQPQFWSVMILVLILTERRTVRHHPQDGQMAHQNGGLTWRPATRASRSNDQNGFR
jgi:O-Antigen ligase